MPTWLSFEFGDFVLTRFLFLRAMAFVYLVAFLIVANQFCPLAGEKGLIPVHHFFRLNSFWDAPSVFFWGHSDRIFKVFAWLGVALSVLALCGYSDRFGYVCYAVVWVSLWALYLSFVNAGGLFYGYGWETLLLEAGFLTLFLGPESIKPHVLVVFLFRWLLFRLMFGGGLIKLRGDECWRNLTCMDYHYETQPLPNPLSWYLHHLPRGLHRVETAMVHFIEIVVPWGFFFPGKIAWIAGGITAVFQIILILSGNLSWLNYLTLALCIPCFDDRALAWLSSHLPRAELTSPVVHQAAVFVFSALVLVLSYRPVKNLLSREQVMNTSYDPIRLVNSYGMFGGITQERHEVVVQGTDSPVLNATTEWREYELKAKPGDVGRRPPILSPYHYKFDWQMWFAAMSPYYENPFTLNLVGKLLEGDRDTLGLFAKNPFPDQPPRFVRLEWYHYQFTPSNDQSGNWWKRERIDAYLDPMSLDNPGLQKALRQLRDSSR